jgi:NAD(P)-dependent dehydrogenase (short-subunit alcohol dehydrogenase family)
MGKLDGKIALVTGGSGSIDFAPAQQFIVESAVHVFITRRCQEALDETVKKFGDTNVTAAQGGTFNLTDLDKLYSVIKKQKGHLDIFFASASGGEFAPLGSITEKHLTTYATSM